MYLVLDSKLYIKLWKFKLEDGVVSTVCNVIVWINEGFVLKVATIRSSYMAYIL